MDKYFLVQVKRTNGTIEKGVVVKDDPESAMQSYHAYLAAYAYGHDPNTDYVLVEILNAKGLGIIAEPWERQVEEENEE